MDLDRNSLLPTVVRIARSTLFNHDRSFKSILRYLVRSLELKDATFSVVVPSTGIVQQEISSSGPRFFTSLRSIKPHVQAVLINQSEPVHDKGVLHLPVIFQHRTLGLLSLVENEDSQILPETIEELHAVCDEIARLAHHVFAGERDERQSTKISLFSELGQALDRTKTLEEVADVAVRTLLRHLGAECVVMRPLLGGTVFDFPRGERRTDSKWTAPFFYDLEETFSYRVISSGRAVLRAIGENKGTSSGDILRVASLPMRAQGKLLGVLTLFFHEAEGLTGYSKHFFFSIASQIAVAAEHLIEREQLEILTRRDNLKLKEMTLLNRITKAMHSTLGINELLHLILSVAAMPKVGGFERAMLFTINERTKVLQGMLGITKRSAALVLPLKKMDDDWGHLDLGRELQDAQKRTRFCRKVLKQRLIMDVSDNALARSLVDEKVVFVHEPLAEPLSGREIAKELGLTPYACVPLLGRDRPLAILVVDNPESGEKISIDRLRFLELFAHQAGSAMENATLIGRLESAHRDLQETHERLIQVEKMAVLGEMAASVAHELKNPLTSVGGYAQRLARRTRPGTEEHEYASVIARHVTRLEGMLGNILGFSKKQLLCFSPFRVSEVIEESLETERGALSEQGVILHLEIGENLPQIQGDRKKLQQVILNLIANARQAMSEGGSLFIRGYKDYLRGEKAVAIEVEDTGGGIPLEVLRNIFNPFFTTKDEGTGLGLSISHRIVELHRGEIEVLNKEGGALFVLRLPVKGIPHLPIDKGGRFG